MTVILFEHGDGRGAGDGGGGGGMAAAAYSPAPPKENKTKNRAGVRKRGRVVLRCAPGSFFVFTSPCMGLMLFSIPSLSHV